ncbi:ribosome biogenesis protein tsr1 [Microbotryomycetes sp. JL221]|nr:ribosome biogenesis protein tsr1 [Microbotryomycetes sp. JL221]
MADSNSQHHHRPTQKQVNKRFKSKHSTKSSLKDQAKGRMHKPVASTSNKHPNATNNKLKAAFTKHNRRNHNKQLMQQKHSTLEQLGSLFQHKNKQGYKVQRVVAIIPLTRDVDSTQVCDQLLDNINVETITDETGGTKSADIAKFHNQSLKFLLLPNASNPASLFAIMDGCAIADFVIFATSSTIEVDYQAETVVRSLTGFGVGSTGGVFGVVNNLPSNQQLASTTRLSLQSYLNHFFPSIDKITCLQGTSASESSNLIRTMCEKIPKPIKWKENRTRMLVEKIHGWFETDQQDKGTLVVEGMVRGSRLSMNRLIHLANYGDFKIDKIFEAPHLVQRKQTTNMTTDEQQLNELTKENLNPDDADSLVSTNVPDLQDMGLQEQTWPTEEEMQSAPIHTGSNGDRIPDAKPGTTPRLKRVPKGTSAYQAAWIIDESDGEYEQGDDDDDDMEGEDQEDEDEDDEEHEMIDPTKESEIDSTRRDNEDEDEDEDDERNDNMTDELSADQERQQFEQYITERNKQRQLENRNDLDFPDEVDTPMDIAARERFARYRGLKSFRTSEWDPYEELPVEYSRCFMFEDFKIMGRKMEKKAAIDGVEAGTRVIVHIKDVPRGFVDQHDPRLPLVVFGLLKHEHKYSVMHYTVTRNTEYNDTVRSKDRLIAQIGFRRFTVNPIFSQHTVRNNGRGTNNVHKFEKYLRHSVTSHVGTSYLPITFGNVPTILFKLPTDTTTDNKTINLVGSGSILSSDPTRITSKRIILTGHPFKVHKKTATIRYMFFNRQDIEYFKPVQLRTKLGRTGFIREPLGTHGYFKANFDGPVSQMDTVCLNLYKRCFPKWSTVWDGSGVDKLVLDDHKETTDVDMA